MLKTSTLLLLFALCSSICHAVQIIDMKAVYSDNGYLEQAFINRGDGGQGMELMEIRDVVPLRAEFGFNLQFNLSSHGQLFISGLQDYYNIQPILIENHQVDAFVAAAQDTRGFVEFPGNYGGELYSIKCASNPDDFILQRQGTSSFVNLLVCYHSRFEAVTDRLGQEFYEEANLFIWLPSQQILIRSDLKLAAEEESMLEPIAPLDFGLDLVDDPSYLLHHIADPITVAVDNPNFDEDDCTICFGTLLDEHRALAPGLERMNVCNHVFHRYCLRRHITIAHSKPQEPFCPNCRQTQTRTF